ncbi:MAG: hypothetical protein IJ759_05390 [Bacteroidales bacterium]|nr:hypothetical protein [Bacteroidales bacterium]
MKKEKRPILIVALVIAVLACIAALCYAITFDNKVPVSEQPTATMFWGIAYWTAFILTVCSALVGIVFLIKDAIGVKARFLIILAATIVVFVISYFIGSANDLPEALFEKTGTALSSSKWITAGLYTVYALFAGVILSLIYAEVSKLIKK